MSYFNIILRCQSLNEMAEIIKRKDNQKVTIKVYDGGKEHDPPHAHAWSTDGSSLTLKNKDCRFLIPRHSYNFDAEAFKDENITYEDIVPYRCEMFINVRKEIAASLNKTYKGSSYKAWIEMIISWNTNHPKRIFKRKQ